MVRWRFCLLLGLLLVLPIKSYPEQEDEEDASEENEENDSDGNDEDEPAAEKSDRQISIFRMTSPTTTVDVATRTFHRRPLECYVCAFKADRPLRSCLDPVKFRVHTMTCQNPEEKCFTSFMFKPSTTTYDAVMRGCRAGCSTSPETTCCESSRCNNQALATPISHTLVSEETPLNKATKSLPPSVLLFVTVLLVLQTVVKVPLV